MEDYLLRNYNHSLHLISESPNENPGLYWLYSDNFLASLALKDNYPDISTTINESIDSYQLLIEDKCQVLLGTNIDDNLFAQGLDQIDIQTIGTRIIRIHKANPDTYMSDWQEYADRLLLASINCANNNEPEQALQLFNQASSMYDGTGFADKVYDTDSYYSIYKLALYLIAASQLEITLPERDSIVNTILEFQDINVASNRYGGIYTDYTADKNHKPGCDTNTETTSLCLIALSL